MKRKVIYIRALQPIVVGEGALIIPLNHSDTVNVMNGHAAYTTPVRSIAPNGTTFETQNSIYQLAQEPDHEVEETMEESLAG
jgi:hypothetical protein